MKFLLIWIIISLVLSISLAFAYTFSINYIQTRNDIKTNYLQTSRNIADLKIVGNDYYTIQVVYDTTLLHRIWFYGAKYTLVNNNFITQWETGVIRKNVPALDFIGVNSQYFIFSDESYYILNSNNTGLTNPKTINVLSSNNGSLYHQFRVHDILSTFENSSNLSQNFNIYFDGTCLLNNNILYLLISEGLTNNNINSSYIIGINLNDKSFMGYQKIFDKSNYNFLNNNNISMSIENQNIDNNILTFNYKINSISNSYLTTVKIQNPLSNQVKIEFSKFYLLNCSNITNCQNYLTPNGFLVSFGSNTTYYLNNTYKSFIDFRSSYNNITYQWSDQINVMQMYSSFSLNDQSFFIGGYYQRERQGINEAMVGYFDLSHSNVRFYNYTILDRNWYFSNFVNFVPSSDGLILMVSFAYIGQLSASVNNYAFIHINLSTISNLKSFTSFINFLPNEIFFGILVFIFSFFPYLIYYKSINDDFQNNETELKLSDFKKMLAFPFIKMKSEIKLKNAFMLLTLIPYLLPVLDFILYTLTRFNFDILNDNNVIYAIAIIMGLVISFTNSYKIDSKYYKSTIKYAILISLFSSVLQSIYSSLLIETHIFQIIFASVFNLFIIIPELFLSDFIVPFVLYLLALLLSRLLQGKIKNEIVS